MSDPALEPTPLDAEDFRRLGVRPNEFRVHVIRSAAMRSSRSLAKSHLVSPSEQTELQLSRVVTSAYRLMDPRLRANPHQRAYVGRILPLTLHAVGSTRFSASSDSNSGGSGSTCPSSPHSSSVGNDLGEHRSLKSVFNQSSPSASAAPAVDPIATETNPANATAAATSPPLAQPPIEDLFQPSGDPLAFGGDVALGDDASGYELWRLSLSEEDLLSPSPIAQKLRRARHRARTQLLKPWVFAIALGLFVGGVMGWLSLISKSPDASSLSVAESKSLPPLASATNTQDQSAPSSLIEKEEQSSASAFAPEHVAAPLDSRNSSAPTVDMASEQSRPRSIEAFPLSPPPPPQRPPLVSSASEKVKEPENVSDFENIKKSNESPYLDDPFAALTPTPSATASASNAAPISASASLASDDDQPRFAVPSATELLIATRQIAEKFPALASASPGSRLDALLAQLDEYGDASEAGSSQHFASILILCRLAWLGGDYPSARQTINKLLEPYQLAAVDGAADSLVAAREHFRLPQEHTAYVGLGLRLFEELIQSRSFDRAAEVLTAIEQSNQLASDLSSSEVIDRAAKSLSQIDRMVQTIDRETQDLAPESIPDIVAGIKGKLDCLYVGGWDQGIRNLTMTSDSRVAGLAKQESQLRSETDWDTVDDVSRHRWHQLADRWWKLSKRLTGRSVQSVQLHALDILLRVADGADAATRLETARMADKWIAELPEHLDQSIKRLRSDLDRTGRQPASTGDRTSG